MHMHIPSVLGHVNSVQLGGIILATYRVLGRGMDVELEGVEPSIGAWNLHPTKVAIARFASECDR